MALKAGLIGGEWEDYHDQNTQPLLDQYDQQINDILTGGAHGAIAQMQAEGDALRANADGGAGDSGAGSVLAAAAQAPQSRTDFTPASVGTGQGVSQSQANEVGAGPANDGDLAYGILGKIWDLPNTALGLGVGALDGLATLATGQLPHIGFGNGALQISNLMDLSDLGLGGGLTLGDVQLYNGVRPNEKVNPSGYFQPDGSQLGGFTYGEHEGGHTMVDDKLGAFALPLYLISAANHGWLTNPYEQKADEHAAYGTSPFP